MMAANSKRDRILAGSAWIQMRVRERAATASAKSELDDVLARIASSHFTNSGVGYCRCWLLQGARHVGDDDDRFVGVENSEFAINTWQQRRGHSQPQLSESKCCKGIHGFMVSLSQRWRKHSLPEHATLCERQMPTGAAPVCDVLVPHAYQHPLATMRTAQCKTPSINRSRPQSAIPV